MMNYLKRRFSSGDLQNEYDDNMMTMPTSLDAQHMNTTISKPTLVHQQTWDSKSSSHTSAPSSPTRNLSFATHVMHVARGVVNQAMQPKPHVQSGIGSSPMTYPSPHHYSTLIQNRDQQNQQISKEKCKLLLIIDDEHTEWSKYFKGKKIFADYDIRVEQAEFKDINMAAYSDAGALVDINIVRQGTRVVRSFRPDFVLVRQYVRDINIDWTNIILGMQYGAVPGVNSMKAMYNFRDKPWIFAELLNIQRRLGAEQFPLINQAYYPNHRKMVSNLWLIAPQFPSVIKVGQAHQGLGKVKVENPYDYQDLTSVVAISNCYSTVEPYIDGRCDVYIQKIGQYYKAFIRKSLTGNWKANTGSAMLEQIDMNDRYRLWIDEVSQLFGGLDICAVEIVQSKDGKEHIVQVNDCSMQLLGETQEEDRRCIAELVMHKMQIYCRPDKQPTILTRVPSVDPPLNELPITAQAPSPISNPISLSTMNTHPTVPNSANNRRELPNVPRNGIGESKSSATSHMQNPFYNPSPPAPPVPVNNSSQIPAHAPTRQTPTQWMGNIGQTIRRQTSGSVDGGDGVSGGVGKDESEDTLANLKKTFAGIFGDMMS